MAAPRPKKKAPVKKAPKPKKPSFLRKDTPRPARDIKPGDMRSQILDRGKPQPAKDLKTGDMRSQALKSASSKGGTVAKGLIKKIPVIGAAAGFIVDAAPAGAGSDRPSGPLMKSNMPGGYGSKTSGYGPTPKKKASVSMPKASMAGGGVNKPGGQSSGNTSRVGGPGGAKALDDVKAKKSGSSKAASVAPAKASSGTSKAATTNVSKTKRRSPTRYQRDETAMEQKFRKG
jgi:hypothetical protein